jgi:hypothetical protein
MRGTLSTTFRTGPHLRRGSTRPQARDVARRVTTDYVPSMSDLYETDVVTWSDRQADLLRRIAAGERVNDLVDWPNVVEEIESVGQSQIDAVESLWTQAFLHDLKAEAWPLARDVDNWRADARMFRHQARRNIGRPCVRGSTFPASTRPHLRACPTRWMAGHRCLCRRPAQ